jgi:hypothetical protein
MDLVAGHSRERDFRLHRALDHLPGPFRLGRERHPIADPGGPAPFGHRSTPAD